jgi:hypothetical protein
MAKVAAVTWFPRTYINIFETAAGIQKVDLKIKDTAYTDKYFSFSISDYGGYGDIKFTQGWSGIHYFVADLPDAGLSESVKKFMVDMQNLLLEKILRQCHSVTYKQIVSDIIPLNFHMLVATESDIDLSGYRVRDVMGMKIGYKPEDAYSNGTMTYVVGSDDEDLLKPASPLLFYSHTNVSSAFLMHLMKSMIRLYHEADNALVKFQEAKKLEDFMEPMDLMDAVVQECTEKNGKIKHVVINFKLKEQEYYSQQFTDTEKDIAQALDVPGAFRRIEADGAYMSVLWGEVLLNRLKNIRSAMDTRMELAQKSKKGWF